MASPSDMNQYKGHLDYQKRPVFHHLDRRGQLLSTPVYVWHGVTGQPEWLYTGMVNCGTSNAVCLLNGVPFEGVGLEYTNHDGRTLLAIPFDLRKIQLFIRGIRSKERMTIAFKDGYMTTKTTLDYETDSRLPLGFQDGDWLNGYYVESARDERAVRLHLEGLRLYKDGRPEPGNAIMTFHMRPGGHSEWSIDHNAT